MLNRTMEFLMLAVGLATVATWAVASADYQGTVVSVDAEKNRIQTMNQEEQETQFEVATSCKITLDGREAALKELVEGTTVTITIKKLKGKQVAVKILARSAE
jgi:hypothetical protein